MNTHNFFVELPDLNAPVPQVRSPSRKTIGLIPVFRDLYFVAHDFTAYLKAAIYSHQTFFLHTDVQETQTA